MTEYGTVGKAMIESLEFRHLRYFVAVAEECNFNRAARRLHLAQPSLSTQIRQLEEFLNAKLFMRTTAGAKLTPAGAALLPHAKRLLRMREQAIEQTTLAQAGTAAPFRLGFSPWLSHDLIHDTLAEYRQLVPDGVVEPSSHSSGPLMRSVLEGKLDAALVNLPIPEEDLSVERVCSERLLICMRSDDPAAAQDAVPRAVVSERMNIMFERDLHPLLFDQIDRRFDKAGVRFRPTKFVSHPAELQLLVQEGIGLGLVREGTPLAENLVQKPLAGIMLTIKSGFVCLPAQRRPVLPLLAYKLAQRFSDKSPHREVTAVSKRKAPAQAVLFEGALVSHSSYRSLESNKVLDGDAR